MSAAAQHVPRGDGYWKLSAARIRDAGYAPVPIAPGKKACYFPGWPTFDFTGLEPQLASCGVGIKTGAVVGLDIDSLDAREVERVEALAERLLGIAPRRVGRAPKALLVYRTETPRKKLAHKLPSGGKVEVLGVGQQFVALHTHPDTQQPYEWTRPLKRFGDLPLVTAEQIDAFLAALAADLPSPQPSRESQSPSGNESNGVNFFAAMTLAELEHELDTGAGPTDRNEWLPTPLYVRSRLWALGVEDHEPYYERWHGWSMRSQGHKDCRQCRKNWDSWDPDKAPAPAATSAEFPAVAEQPSAEGSSGTPIVAYRMSAASIDAYRPTLEALLAHAEDWRVLGFGRTLRQPWEAERDGFRGRKVKALELQPLSGAALRNVLSTRIEFHRVLNSGERRKTDAPAEVCAELAQRPQDWHAIEVDRVALTPIFREGKLITARGHCREARAYIDAPDVTLDSDLSRAGAERNLATLAEWLDEFPFETELDRSAALCALLTAACRASLPAAPGIIVDKPVYGAGGSTLCDLIHVVLTGKPAAVVSMAAGRDANDELRKHIDACQLGGYPALTVDNLPEGMTITDLPALAQLLTQPERDIRVLGESRTVRITCSQLVLLNGNNVSVGKDFVRRFIRVRLEQKTERPEQRTFKRPEIISDAIAARAAILSAAYSIIAAYRASGARSKTQLAGFEPWLEMCAAPLEWLGLPNPIATQANLATDDESRSLHLEVMQAIAEMRGGDWWRVGDLLAEAGLSESGVRLSGLLRDSDLMDALRFGYWLRSLRGRLAGGLRIERDPTSRAQARWRIAGAEPRATDVESFADLLRLPS